MVEKEELICSEDDKLVESTNDSEFMKSKYVF